MFNYPAGSLAGQLATLATTGGTPDEWRSIADRVLTMERLLDGVVADVMADVCSPLAMMAPMGSA